MGGGVIHVPDPYRVRSGWEGWIDDHASTAPVEEQVGVFSGSNARGDGPINSGVHGDVRYDDDKNNDDNDNDDDDREGDPEGRRASESASVDLWRSGGRQEIQVSLSNGNKVSIRGDALEVAVEEAARWEHDHGA